MTHTLQHDQLRIVRNLSSSAFGALSSNAGLRDAFSEAQVQRINSLIYKVRSRFDSWKVLVQEVKDGEESEGAIALVESMFSHVYMIQNFLAEEGLDDRNPANQVLSAEITEELLPIRDFCADAVDPKTIQRSIRLPARLATVMPSISAYWYSVSLAITYGETILLRKADSLSRIVREISFPAEFQQAGVAILNYFSVVLGERYPDIPVSVSIKQERNIVQMVITLPDGSEETVTKLLNDYGLVVIGQMAPKDLVHDDLKALALQQKLELAQMEIRQSRDLIRIQEQYASSRIGSLESEIENLYTLLAREFTSREKLQEGLMKLSSQAALGSTSADVIRLMSELTEAISEKNAERTRILLEDIQQNEPDLFSRLAAFFSHAATSGVIGNAIYDWLKVLWPVLPK